MPGIPARIRFLAVVLGIVFLAAQFHFCADLTSDPASLHRCPLCTTLGSAIVTDPPAVALLASPKGLEIFAVSFASSGALSRARAPRAPPAL
jgi:hypothetical protein